MKISSLDISNRFKTLQMRKNRKYPNRVNYPKIIGTNNVQYRTLLQQQQGGNVC